jgi:periplasmic divalent cation tolerance protein
MAQDSRPSGGMKHFFVYITARDADEARRIGRALVEARLAACVNRFDGMQSIYRWKGELHEDHEAVLIAKTTDARLPALIDKVKALHSYENPCIVAWPLAAGYPDFLKYIESETDSEPAE